MRKYTRISAFLLALVMCLTMLTAQAESELPEEVADLFTVKAWAHYAIADHPGMPENKAFAVMREESGYEAALLVMRNTKSETNVLVLAEKSSAQADWKITMRNWGAVEQGDANVPQLAALADTHMLIAKSEHDGRTYTTVTPLDRKGRAMELARIIGGTNITETTLKSAEEMLLSGK